MFLEVLHHDLKIGFWKLDISKVLIRIILTNLTLSYLEGKKKYIKMPITAPQAFLWGQIFMGEVAAL